MFSHYCKNKSEGSLGQDEKAVRMLQWRKIVSVKTLKNTFVKAMIKKSYGTEVRPAVIFFKGRYHKSHTVTALLVQVVFAAVTPLVFKTFYRHWK